MGRINKIDYNDVVNGEGIMISVWFQGCPHRCKGCFNEVTWDFNSGIKFSESHIKQVSEYIDKDNVNRNMSILGGESLCKQNIEDTLKLCKKFKNEFPNKKIYLWTGYTYESFNYMQKEVLKYIDVLIDGKFEEDKKDLSLKLRGSKNQRVINVQESIKNNKIVEIDSK